MTMRAIGFGVLCMAAVLSGCQDSQVMQKRPFVPEAEQEPWSRPVKSNDTIMPEAVETVETVEVVEVIKPLDIKPMGDTWSKDAPKSAEASGKFYTVKKGDILGRVARNNGTTAGKMAEYNGFSVNDPIKVGQKLQIPPKDYTGGAASGVKPSTKRNTEAKATPKPSSPASTSRTDIPADGLYSVVSGDSIGKIANKFGIKQRELLAANHMDSKSIIRPGQRLVIPKSGAVAAVNNAAGTPVAADRSATTGQDKAQVKTDQNLENIGAEDDAAAIETAELINEDISVEAFAAKHGTTVDALGTVNIMPADGMFRKDALVSIPKK